MLFVKVPVILPVPVGEPTVCVSPVGKVPRIQLKVVPVIVLVSE